MLKIREAQMDIFKGDIIREFVDGLVHHVKAEFPSHYATLRVAGTRALIERAIEDGKSNGIHSHGAIAVLVELRVEFGERFERAPARDKALKILAHPELPDYLKMQIIRTTFEDMTQGRRLKPFVPPPA